MSLTDIMSAMQLHSFAEAGLVLFFIAFLAIAIQIFRTRHDDVWEHARHLPLDAAPITRPSDSARPLARGPSDP
jgi:hypothetical protein